MKEEKQAVGVDRDFALRLGEFNELCQKIDDNLPYRELVELSTEAYLWSEDQRNRAITVCSPIEERVASNPFMKANLVYFVYTGGAHDVRMVIPSSGEKYNICTGFFKLGDFSMIEDPQIHRALIEDIGKARFSLPHTRDQILVFLEWAKKTLLVITSSEPVLSESELKVLVKNGIFGRLNHVFGNDLMPNEAAFLFYGCLKLAANHLAFYYSKVV